MTIGSSFSSVLTQRGDIYVSGRLGGREEGEGWGLLHDSRGDGERMGEKVMEVRAGLHYLAAVVGDQEGKGQHLLLWGRPNSASQTSSLPTEAWVIWSSDDSLSLSLSLSLCRWNYHLHC